jgi:hypothetical protein
MTARKKLDGTLAQRLMEALSDLQRPLDIVQIKQTYQSLSPLIQNNNLKDIVFHQLMFITDFYCQIARLLNQFLNAKKIEFLTSEKTATHELNYILNNDHKEEVDIFGQCLHFAWGSLNQLKTTFYFTTGHKELLKLEKQFRLIRAHVHPNELLPAPVRRTSEMKLELVSSPDLDMNEIPDSLKPKSIPHLTIRYGLFDKKNNKVQSGLLKNLIERDRIQESRFLASLKRKRTKTESAAAQQAATIETELRRSKRMKLKHT